MDSAPSIDEVFQAIRALYCESDSSSKEKASAWLDQIQKSVYAWQVADKLLLENRDLQSCYFAAQTMKTKIELCFNELPIDSHQSLRDSLLQHCINITGDTPPSIVTQLCQALSDLALQMPTWKNSAAEIIQQFGNNARHWRFLLEFLTLLPEEIDRKQLRLGFNRRDDVSNELLAASQLFIQLLTAMMASAPTDDQFQSKVFTCLGSWCCMSVIDPQLLLASNLLQTAFAALANKDCPQPLHHAASDCICQSMFTNEELEKELNMAKSIYEGVMSLVGPYQYIVSIQDADRAANFCRLFNELAEAVITPLTTRPNQGFGDFCVLEVMLTCFAYPSFDVADISMTFWEKLSDALYNASNPQLCEMLKPYMERLVMVLCQHCRYPASQINRSELSDDFEDFRLQCGEFVHDLNHVLAPTTVMMQMLAVANGGGQGASWEVSESALFIMAHVAKYIDVKDETVVPTVLNLVLNIPPTAHVCIRNTSIQLLGLLARWLNAHSGMIENVLKYIFGCLQQPQLLKTSVAALRNICFECPNGMATHFVPIVGIMQTIDAASMPEKTIHQLLESLGAILSFMPHNALEEGFHKLCLMQLDTLNTILSQDVPVVEKQKLTDPAVWVDRLSIIFRETRVKIPLTLAHPCQPTIEHIWPLLSKSCEKYAHDGRIIERVCRCMRYAIRCLDNHTVKIFNLFLNQIVELYKVHPHSCCLYIGSVLVDVCANQPTHVPTLLNMLNSFCFPTFEVLEQENGMRNNPDLVEDLYRLADRLMQKTPMQLLMSPCLRPLLQCAIVGSTQSHREAHCQTMFFLSDFVRAASENPENDDFASRQQKVVAIVKELGPSMVSMLLKASIFELPKINIQWCAEVIYELMSLDKQSLLSWLEVAIKSIPTQRPTGTITATATQLQAFFMSMSSAEKLKDVVTYFNEFAVLFR